MSLRYVNTVEVLRDNDYEESGGSEDSKHKMRTNIIISEVREYNRSPYYLENVFGSNLLRSRAYQCFKND